MPNLLGWNTNTQRKKWVQLVTYLWQIFNLGQKYVLKFCQSHILIYNISVNFKKPTIPKAWNTANVCSPTRFAPGAPPSGQLSAPRDAAASASRWAPAGWNIDSASARGTPSHRGWPAKRALSAGRTSPAHGASSVYRTRSAAASQGHVLAEQVIHLAYCIK